MIRAAIGRDDETYELATDETDVPQLSPAEEAAVISTYLKGCVEGYAAENQPN